MTPYDHASEATSFPCTHCNAQPGEDCTRPSGNPAPWQHAARRRLVFEAERGVL
jgi:hypothetical protein